MGQDDKSVQYMLNEIYGDYLDTEVVPLKHEVAKVAISPKVEAEGAFTLDGAVGSIRNVTPEKDQSDTHNGLVRHVFGFGLASRMLGNPALGFHHLACMKNEMLLEASKSFDFRNTEYTFKQKDGNYFGLLDNLAGFELRLTIKQK